MAATTGELNDFVKSIVDFSSRHPHDGTVEIDIFAPTKLRVESGSDFEKTGNSTLTSNPAAGWRGDA